MEKRFRDYLRHFEKLDFDVLSDEEIISEKEEIGLHVSILQHELLRKLLIALAAFVCGFIMLAAGLVGQIIIADILGIVILVFGIIMVFSFKESHDVLGRLCVFVDKLTMLN